MVSLLMSSIYSQVDELNSLSHTYQPLNKIEFRFQLNYSPSQNPSNIAFGLIWWPSNNLYLSGILDPIIDNNELSLYHNVVIGYSNPEWKWFKTTDNAFEFGIHRLQYKENSKYAWFHATYHFRKIGDKFGWGGDFTQYIDEEWSIKSLSLVLLWTPISQHIIELGVEYNEISNFQPILNLSLAL